MGEVSRSLGASDVAGVVNLVRACFDPQILPFMVYGQHGMDRFLSNALRFPVATRDIVRVVVDGPSGASGPAAFADLRLLTPELGFLSYICVAPEQRGKGLARRLISELVCAHPRLTSLELDVFDDNAAARAMYDGLGFLPAGAKTWVTRDIARRPDIGVTATIPSLPTALAAYDQFGFCELDVVLADRTARLGLMGDVVRCRGVDDLQDDALLSDIGHILPHVGTALAVVPAEDPALPTSGLDTLLRSQRMTLSLASRRSGE